MLQLLATKLVSDGLVLYLELKFRVSGISLKMDFGKANKIFPIFRPLKVSVASCFFANFANSCSTLLYLSTY